VTTPPRHLAARLPGTVGTSAAAHAVAASVRRLLVTSSAHVAPGGDDAARLAEMLAHMMMATASSEAPRQLPEGVRVEAADKGHLNFIRADAAAHAPGNDAVMAPGSPPEADARLQRFCKYRARKQQRRQQQEAARGEQQQPSPVPDAAPGSSRQLVVVTRPSCFDAAEFELYCRYQTAVHGDSEAELTAASYTRFLVTSPLLAVPPGPGTPSCGYGTFHRQYWLGDKLVAVGVCDVLPRSVSSVYLFYDPDYAGLSLGKATACEEIAWVAGEQAQHSPGLEFYHLGLFIPTCKKMSYKAAFKPSQLLCPRTMRWVPLEDVPIAELDGRMPLAPPDAHSGEHLHAERQPSPEELGACRLLFPSAGIFRFADVRAALSPATAELLRSRLADWVTHLGPEVARRAACVCYA
jgi:arginine-tRNA-protein transferase